MEFKFADRQDELPLLRAFLRPRTNRGEAAVCIVAAPSGVGKSRLADEAATTAGTAAPFVRVPIRQWEPQSGESGFFLRTCALAVSEASGTRGYIALDSFGHRRGGWSAIRAGAAGSAKKVEKALVGGESAIGPAIDAWGVQQRAVRSLLGEPSTEALKIAADYLQRVARDRGLVLAIENAQTIDKESLYYLLELSEEFDGVRLIFEYTVAEDQTGNPWSYSSLADACRSTGLPILELKLAAIPFAPLAQANFWRLDERYVQALRHTLDRQGGNIRELERLHDISTRGGPPSASAADAIAVFASQLTDEQKIVLWIVILYRDRIDPYELSDICELVPLALRPNAPAHSAARLEPFVRQIDGLFSADHDSLYHRLEAVDGMRRYLLVAAEALSRYFSGFLEQPNFVRYSEYEILFALLFLSVPLSSSPLLDLAVRRLSTHAREAGRPAGLVRRVLDFVAAVGERRLQVQTVKDLIGILYDACWIEGSLQLTERFRESSPEIALCHCQALALTGRHSEAEAELRRINELAAADGVTTRRTRLAAYAALMGPLIARVRGDYSEARKRYSRLCSAQFRTPEDLCVFYRFGEIADAEDSLERLATAREIAMTLEDKTDLVRTNLALCTRSAERGAIEEALERLSEAEAAGATNYVDAYMVANNRLAAEALGGRDLTASFAALEQRLALIVDSLDRVLVANNLLASAAILGDHGRITRYRRMVEELQEHLVEPNIGRISLYNCSRAYALEGLNILAADCAAKAFDLPIGFDSAYWNGRRSGSRDATVDFRLSLEFDVPMMTNWYFRWPDFAERPE